MNLLQMSISASWLIAAIIILRWFFLNKVPKLLFQIFWGVAAVRLLVPFSFSFRFNVHNLMKRFADTAAGPAVKALPDTVSILKPDSISGNINTGLIQAVSPALFMWAAGAVILSLYLLAVNIKARKCFSTSVPLGNDSIQRYVEQEIGLRRVQVRTSDRIQTPLTYGILRPVILLPKTMGDTNRTVMNYILTHELLHIRRFDYLKKLLLLLIVCMHWFNPLVWLMYILANRDIELACDEGVLQTLGRDLSSEYAFALIAMQEKLAATVCANSFSRYAIKERIISIMKYKKTSIMAVAAASVLMLGVTTVFASSAKTETDYIQEAEAESMEMTIGADDSDSVSVTMDENVETGEFDWEFNDSETDIEWWTVEEYEAWIEEQRRELSERTGENEAEDVERILAESEEILQLMKEGMMISKTVNGSDDIVLSYSVSDTAELTEAEDLVD